MADLRTPWVYLGAVSRFKPPNEPVPVAKE